MPPPAPRGPCHNVPHMLAQPSLLLKVRHRFTVRILFGSLAPNRSQVATKCEKESSEVVKLPAFPPRPDSQILLCDIFYLILTSLINLSSSISYLRLVCCALSSSQNHISIRTLHQLSSPHNSPQPEAMNPCRSSQAASIRYGNLPIILEPTLF